MSIKNLLPGTIGLGGAPLGNMFRAIPEDEAHATVSEARNTGVRYFDTAPLYGSGLSEIRMGEALSQYPRDEYVLSSKVGRIMLDEMEDPAKRDFGEKGGLFEHGLKNKILNDYSADATLRSIEDSLKRLKTDRLDIVWIHDPAQDFYGDSWLEQFNIARTGAFRALTRLRDEGVIKAQGTGCESRRTLRTDAGAGRTEAGCVPAGGALFPAGSRTCAATPDARSTGTERGYCCGRSVQLWRTGRRRAL